MNKNKKQVFLLFKNAFKQALRNKIQLIGLIILVLLSSTIFSILETSITRIKNQYDNLIAESNIHNFVIDLSNTIEKQKVSGDDNNVSADQYAIAKISDKMKNTNQQFSWDRVESRTVQLNNNNNPRTLKLVADQYATIDKLVISEGYNIGTNKFKTPESKQVVVNQQFAEKNNLKIGDVIRVQADNLGDSLKVNYDINNPKFSDYDWLQIVGFGSSADFTTPIIDKSTIIPNKTTQGIIYVANSQFGLTPSKTKDPNYILWDYNKNQELITITSQSDQEIYYVGKFNDQKANNKTNIKLISNNLKIYYSSSSDQSASLVYALGDSNYIFNDRTSTLPKTINAFTILLILLLLIVLTITGITVILITYKNIDNAKPSIGILKSLGYSNWKILITSLAYPMIAALIGTIFVFLPGSALQIVIIKTFANYFNLNFGKFILNGLSFVYCLILTFGFLSVIAWIISALTVVKKPIDLINNIVKSRSLQVTNLIKKTTKNRKFTTRFKTALFTSSMGKMAAVSLTMFLGTTLMSASVIGPKIMADNKIVNYTGMNYKSLVQYTSPVWNSPFSFLKTYNPNDKPWGYFTQTNPGATKDIYSFPNRNTGKQDNNTTSAQDSYDPTNNQAFWNDLVNNSINSEAYAPITTQPTTPNSLQSLAIGSLSFLYGKMITKSFLNGLDNSTTDPSLINALISMLWPDANDTSTIANDTTPNLANEDFSKLLNYYQILRTFYIKYRSTINMNLNPAVSINNKTIDTGKIENFLNVNSTTANNLFAANKTSFEQTLSKFNFDTTNKIYPWHINNEEKLLNTPDPSSNQKDFVTKWIEKVLIWYYSLFYNRVGQIVEQGVYSQSPYFIRQNIANAFEDPNKQFNISFDVIPYNSKTDELGTYFTGTPNIQFNNKTYPITVYGIQSKQELGKDSLMQLYNSSGVVLNNLLTKTNSNNDTNIIINQTVAKQLHLKVGQEFSMDPNKKTLEYNNQNLTANWNKNDIDATDTDGNPASQYNNNVTMNLQNIGFKEDSALSSDAYSSLGSISPSAMTTEVQNHNVTIKNNLNYAKFKVVGIYNGYGQPTAYVSKDNADKLLGYNTSKKDLYNIFYNEWSNSQQPGISTTDWDKYNSYDNLLKQINENHDKTAQSLLKIFNTEYPVFNFKYSISEALPDVTSCFAISQSYGDYTQIGLNGGTGYTALGVGSANSILPLSSEKQILNQITSLVDTILIFFIVFSLIISFFIILLTSDLVIYENRKVIASMKTLGYSDIKITNIVIGMYLPAIILMFAIGFPAGWFIIQLIINFLAAHSTWVLPLFFSWWLPVIVAIIVLGIYVTTFLIEWNALKRIEILKILNENN